jgi:hypothetical protein
MVMAWVDCHIVSLGAWACLFEITTTCLDGCLNVLAGLIVYRTAPSGMLWPCLCCRWFPRLVPLSHVHAFELGPCVFCFCARVLWVMEARLVMEALWQHHVHKRDRFHHRLVCMLQLFRCLCPPGILHLSVWLVMACSLELVCFLPSLVPLCKPATRHEWHCLVAEGRLCAQRATGWDL